MSQKQNIRNWHITFGWQLSSTRTRGENICDHLLPKLLPPYNIPNGWTFLWTILTRDVKIYGNFPRNGAGLQCFKTLRTSNSKQMFSARGKICADLHVRTIEGVEISPIHTCILETYTWNIIWYVHASSIGRLTQLHKQQTHTHTNKMLRKN